MPLHTMSYCQARMSSGSCVFRASSPPCGIENGLWLNPIAPLSFFSCIGESTIQQNRYALFSMRSARLAASTRTSLITLATSVSSPAPKNTAVPAPPLTSAMSCCVTFSVRNLAIGPVSWPLSPIRTQANPCAPRSTANAPSWSKNERGLSPQPGTGSAWTCLPEKARNSLSRKRCETSASSRFARRSGLSVRKNGAI